MQTNGVIYLPVVVKGATRVGGNVRRGSQQTRHIHPMLVQCQRRRRWPNNVPALGGRLLFATTVDPVINDPATNDLLSPKTFFSCTDHFSIVTDL